MDKLSFPVLIQRRRNFQWGELVNEESYVPPAIFQVTPQCTLIVSALKSIILKHRKCYRSLRPLASSHYASERKFLSSENSQYGYSLTVLPPRSSQTNWNCYLSRRNLFRDATPMRGAWHNKATISRRATSTRVNEICSWNFVKALVHSQTVPNPNVFQVLPPLSRRHRRPPMQLT